MGIWYSEELKAYVCGNCDFTVTDLGGGEWGFKCAGCYYEQAGIMADSAEEAIQKASIIKLEHWYSCPSVLRARHP